MCMYLCIYVCSYTSSCCFLQDFLECPPRSRLTRIQVHSLLSNKGLMCSYMIVFLYGSYNMFPVCVWTMSLCFPLCSYVFLITCVHLFKRFPYVTFHLSYLLTALYICFVQFSYMFAACSYMFPHVSHAFPMLVMQFPQRYYPFVPFLHLSSSGPGPLSYTQKTLKAR